MVKGLPLPGSVGSPPPQKRYINLFHEGKYLLWGEFPTSYGFCGFKDNQAGWRPSGWGSLWGCLAGGRDRKSI